MEYVQMTLSDWLETKAKLNAELLGIKRSFVKVGYLLRRIEESRGYENDGYKSIAEFAKQEYGLEGSTVSRFIAINREYSIDGFSDQLRPEFEELKRSQLEEMLGLPEEDRKMIEADTPRAQIRELKQFNKAEPAAGEADDVKELIKKFYRDNKDILNEVFENIDVGTTDSLSEIVNPSGSKSFKKGIFFLMMYESKISIKKFGSNPENMTWEEFFDITRELFPEPAAGRTWEKYFGQDEDNAVDIVNKSEEKEEPEEIVENAPEEAIAPAQNSQKILEENESETEIIEQKTEEIAQESKEIEEETEEIEILPLPFPEEIVENVPEEPIAPAQNFAEILEEKESEPDKSEDAFGTRKEYMESLTEEEMAKYMSNECQQGRLMKTYLDYPALIKIWLSEEVNWEGQPMKE